MGITKRMLMEEMDGPPSAEIFRDWMSKHNWELAVECCPVDRGEYIGATDGDDVWVDFVEAHPEFEDDDELRSFVYDQGPYGRYDIR